MFHINVNFYKKYYLLLLCISTLQNNSKLRRLPLKPGNQKNDL